MLTLVTCYYIVKSKADLSTYIKWASNFLPNVKNCNIVVYTDEKAYPFLKAIVEGKDGKDTSNIAFVIKPMEQFHNYKYKEQWLKNQEKNYLLSHVSWELQLIWAEKATFVKQAYENKYFDSDWYAWCDIGYFRGRECDMECEYISSWPKLSHLDNLSHNTIYYVRVNNDDRYMQALSSIILNKNSKGMPKVPIPPDQVSIGGCFFLTYHTNIDWWWRTYDKRLSEYFENEYLVKDDQIIVIDCIVNNPERFSLIQEFGNRYDNWFAFQRFLA
jgi:hypothetical protein